MTKEQAEFLIEQKSIIGFEPGNSCGRTIIDVYDVYNIIDKIFQYHEQYKLEFEKRLLDLEFINATVKDFKNFDNFCNYIIKNKIKD